MAQPVMQDHERDLGRPDRAPDAGQVEPATARALWPTFMRRTLTEDAIRRQPEPVSAK